MTRFHAIAWTMGIWATAFSTLLAGVPHLQCRCPDGRIKPFCLSILLPSTCCDRSCCAAPVALQAQPCAQQDANKTCCCCEQSRRFASSPRSVSERGESEQLRPMGCQKTIVKAQLTDRSDSVRYPASDFVSLLPDGPGSIPFLEAQLESGRFTASPHWPPPSSDLIVALGRLLI